MGDSTTEQGKKPAHSAVDENTPLLVASQAGAPAQSNEEPLLHAPVGDLNEDNDKPLPTAQILWLCYARLVEPVAFFSIFPFINQMLWETGGLNEADVGFYSGLIESCFSLTQMVLMIQWGRAADRFGRKPVMVCSLFGMAISTTLFGFSTKIWQMVLFRCIAGVFAGTVVTVRTMISEHSTPKTQARAFSWFAFTSNLGIFVGPFIGGLLSQPARQYPSVFGGVRFFKDYPYALPTIVTGFISLTAAVTTVLFVEETLTVELRAKNKESPHAMMTTWELLKYPGVAIVLFIYSCVMLLALAYTAVAPVFYYTEPALGGFGFTPFWISVFIGIGGASQALWTLVVFPPLHRRIGSGGILRLASSVSPFFYVAWPLCNFILSKKWTVAFWIFAPILNIVGSGIAMAFTAVQLALNDISPSNATLGTLNALALTAVSGIRAVAPILFSSLFAVGVKYQILWGYLAWAVIIAISISYLFIVRFLPEKAEGKLKRDEHDD